MYGGRIRGHAENSTCVLVATDGGLFKTTDGGQSWNNVTLTFNTVSVKSQAVVSLGTDFYAESDTNTGVSIYKSQDNGANWIQVTFPAGTSWNPQAMSMLGNELYLVGIDYTNGQTGRLYASADGITWTPKALLFTNSSFSGNLNLVSFSPDKLFLYLQNNLYYTTDGITLNAISVSGLGITAFAIDSKTDIQGDAAGNLYYYFNNQVFKYNFTTSTWSNISSGTIPAGYQIMGISGTENALFVVALPPSNSMKFYRSTDHGASFTEQTATGLQTPMISNIIEISANGFIGNGLYEEILVSSTGGSSWTSFANQFIASYAGNLVNSGSNLLFSTQNRGVILSTNQGLNWTSNNTGIPGFGGIAFFVNELIQVKDTVFTLLQPSPFSQDVVLYKSTDKGVSWKPSPVPVTYSKGSAYTFAGKCDSALFVNYYDSVSFKYAQIVTFDNGASWVKPNSQNSNQLTYLKGSHKFLFAFNAYPNDWNDFSNVYRANSFGLSFTDINPAALFNTSFTIKRIVTSRGDKGEPIMDVDVPGNKAIVAVMDRTMGNGIERLYQYNITTNAWSEIITGGLPANYISSCIKCIGNNTWLLATNTGLYRSTNGGGTWVITHQASNWLKGITVNKIYVMSNQVFLGTLSNGIWTVNLPTGVLSPLADGNLVVYPNPTSGRVQIQIPDFTGTTGTLTLYDMDGKVMITKPVTANPTMLDIHTVAAGNYILVINSANRVYRKSILRK